MKNEMGTLTFQTRNLEFAKWIGQDLIDHKFNIVGKYYLHNDVVELHCLQDQAMQVENYIFDKLANNKLLDKQMHTVGKVTGDLIGHHLN